MVLIQLLFGMFGTSTPAQRTSKLTDNIGTLLQLGNDFKNNERFLAVYLDYPTGKYYELWHAQAQYYTEQSA